MVIKAVKGVKVYDREKVKEWNERVKVLIMMWAF